MGNEMKLKDILRESLYKSLEAMVFFPGRIEAYFLFLKLIFDNSYNIEFGINKGDNANNKREDPYEMKGSTYALVSGVIADLKKVVKKTSKSSKGDQEFFKRMDEKLVKVETILFKERKGNGKDTEYFQLDLKPNKVYIDFIKAFELDEKRGNNEDYYYLGRMYELANCFCHDQTEVKRAERINKDEKAAMTYYDRILDENLNNTYALMRIAKIQQYKMEYDKAINTYSVVINNDSWNAKAYKERGDAYQSLGLYNDAVNDYKNAIEAKNDYFLAYLERGKLFCEMRKYNLALMDFMKANSIEKTFCLPYIFIGNVYRLEGMKDYAKKWFDLAQKIRTNDNNVNTVRIGGRKNRNITLIGYYMYNLVYRISERREINEFIKNIERLKIIKSYKNLFFLGEIFLQHYKYLKNLCLWDKCNHVNGRNVEPITLSYLKKARNAFEEALSVNNECPRTVFKLLEIYERLNEYGESICTENEIISMDKCYELVLKSKTIGELIFVGLESPERGPFVERLIATTEGRKSSATEDNLYCSRVIDVLGVEKLVDRLVAEVVAYIILKRKIAEYNLVEYCEDNKRLTLDLHKLIDLVINSVNIVEPKLYILKALLYEGSDDIRLAKKYMKMARCMSLDNQNLAVTNLLLGKLYYRRRQMEKALTCIEVSRKYSKEYIIGNKLLIEHYINNCENATACGAVPEAYDLLEKSIRYMEKAYRIPLFLWKFTYLMESDGMKKDNIEHFIKCSGKWLALSDFYVFDNIFDFSKETSNYNKEVRGKMGLLYFNITQVLYFYNKEFLRNVPDESIQELNDMLFSEFCKESKKMDKKYFVKIKALKDEIECNNRKLTSSEICKVKRFFKVQYFKLSYMKYIEGIEKSKEGKCRSKLPEVELKKVYTLLSSVLGGIDLREGTEENYNALFKDLMKISEEQRPIANKSIVKTSSMMLYSLVLSIMTFESKENETGNLVNLCSYIDNSYSGIFSKVFEIQEDEGGLKESEGARDSVTNRVEKIIKNLFGKKEKEEAGEEYHVIIKSANDLETEIERIIGGVK